MRSPPTDNVVPVVTALARRLTSIASVELARLQLQHADRFIREELLYPELASGVSQIKWQPSAEVPIERSKTRKRGDVPRADLSFWRSEGGPSRQLEVCVEVKLMKDGLPQTSKGWEKLMRELRERMTKVSSGAPSGRQRVAIGLLVGAVPTTKHRRDRSELAVDRCRRVGLKRLATANVVAEYPTWSVAVTLQDSSPRDRRSVS
jgi:hypothetical protein